MTNKYGISLLLQDLHQLYDKLCTIDLNKRMSLYHRNTTSNSVPDITRSLTAHFDQLTAAGKLNKISASDITTIISSKRPEKPDDAKQTVIDPSETSYTVSTFTHTKETYTAINASDQYMGEKLKDSTWSHLHSAMLKARQGDVINAKLHADIANNAFKEAAHYMSDEDYEVLCEQVVDAFKELDG